MSRIDELIAEQRPEGVEFLPLGEIGTWYGGGTPSKSREDYWRGGTIPWLSPKDMGTPTITTTQDYITKAAVAGSATKLVPAKSVALVVRSSILERHLPTALVTVPIALNQDMKAVVPRDDVLPEYLAHLLRAQGPVLLARARKKGGSVASIEVPKLLSARIPVPPIAVQQELVRTLDAFTALQADLEAELDSELEARRGQYTHHRDRLLDFDRRTVGHVRLSELGSIFSGLTGKAKADFQDGNARFVTYMNVYDNLSVDTEPDTRVRVGPRERQTRVSYGDVLFTASSESFDEVGMSSAVTVEPSEPLYLNSFCFGWRPHRPADLNPEFAKHLFRSASVRRQIIKTANGVTRINVSKARFRDIAIAVPPREEQDRIAEILDALDALVSDLSAGLPAEIRARRQQYEYYRDRLLTFKEPA